MNLKVSTKEFCDGIKLVGQIATDRFGILLDVKDGRLTMTSTNLGVSISHSIPICSIEDDESTTNTIALSCNIIKKFASALPRIETSDVISLSSINKECTISYTDGKTKIPCLVNMFPTLPTDGNVKYVEIDGVSLYEMLKTVSHSTDSGFTTTQSFGEFSASKQNLSKIYEGIFIDIKDDNLSIFSTDEKRMSFVSCKINNDKEILSNCVVDVYWAQLIKYLTLRNRGTMHLGIDESRIYTKAGSALVIAQLLSTKHVPYNEVLNESHDKSFEIDRLKLLNGFSITACSASLLLQKSEVSFENGFMTIKTMSPDSGESNVKLDIDYTGETCRMAVNPLYIIDALKASTEPVVCIKIQDKDTSLIIQDGLRHTELIMPMDF